MATTVDAVEAIKGLVAIVGPVGITGALVAFWGYKQQASKGRGDAPALTPGALSATPSSAKDVELLSNSVTQLHGGISRLALIMEFVHVERTHSSEAFGEFADRRQLQAELAEFRAQKGKAS